ncbi:MAG: hypothetical protein ABIS01_10705 [Ferruginibacter sp.]
MKPQNLAIAIATAFLIISFTACKKANSAKAEIETTIELSTEQAVADNLTEDANDIFMEAATQNGLTGEATLAPFQSRGMLACASVTITPLTGFPKIIVINFGTGCTSANGIIRKGKINIVLSDSSRKTGSTAVLTFDTYYVNGFKKEGTVTWTNNNTATSKGWQRKVENGKITAPNGKYWLHSGVKNVVQTAGYNTPRNLLDDVFLITGTSTISNSNSETSTSSIIDALEKSTACENITKGSIELNGPNHSAVIDFGNGECDNTATISVDGGAKRTILLR